MSEAREGSGKRFGPAGKETAEGFGRLLEWLGQNREQGGEGYERVRRKLIRFFQWRGQTDPETLADETIDRVTRKLGQGTVDRGLDPGAFFYGVARNILREQRSEGFRRREAVRELSGTPPAQPEKDPERDRQEKRLDCLDRCLLALSPRSRELILAYYQGVKGEKIENRKALADRLAIPMNALWIRAHRVRLELESCVERCAGAGGVKSIRIESQEGQGRN